MARPWVQPVFAPFALDSRPADPHILLQAEAFPFPPVSRQNAQGAGLTGHFMAIIIFLIASITIAVVVNNAERHPGLMFIPFFFALLAIALA